MTAPRVFVTQENQNQNYRPAEQFGEVVFLTRGELSPIKNSLNNTAIMADLRKKLKDFRAEVDFIAPSGSPIITGLAFVILAERTDRFTALRWSNRDGAYMPIPVQI